MRLDKLGHQQGDYWYATIFNGRNLKAGKQASLASLILFFSLPRLGFDQR
jgi:hypothetical protein